MGIWKDLLKSLVRHALNGLFAWMIMKGWITQEQADSWLDPMVLQIVGWIGVVAVYAWSSRDKVKTWLFGRFALAAPAHTPPEAIKAEIKEMSEAEKISTVLTAAPLPDNKEGTLT
jgi:hypothetical protein